MPSSLIVGSGPAAAGAALALSKEPDQRITVIDIGGRLDAVTRELVATMAATPHETWTRAKWGDITVQPVPASSGSIPEKRSYGSDFPFRDFGQLEGVQSVGRVNGRVISGAYGGYSNVWGAQIMPFTAATLAQWPIRWRDLEPHYRAILQEVPLAGQDDDLASLFPLLVKPRPLPPLAERSRWVIDRYEARRAKIRSLGVVIGAARLAMRAEDCVQCGLCMTGCPYELIYSASHTFDRLIRTGRITYHSGLLAVGVGQRGEHEVVVTALELGANRHHDFTANRVFLAAGAMGTTRLVLGSLQQYERPVTLLESAQFVVPSLSRRPTPDPRRLHTFTLNQFNLLVDTQGDGVELSQIHYYPYNPTFLESLPGPLRERPTSKSTSALLRRVSVGLGYLPSWNSPRLEVTAKPGPEGGLAELTVDQKHAVRASPMLRLVLKTLLRAAPHLDLWPILPKVSVSQGGKSYHFGGSFPHSEDPAAGAPLASDRLGRLPQWDRVHLVDASVFPTVPATTFTLTVMANAHRIANESLGLGPD
jgi:choline dehydrogenase-like flavoprotein